VHCPFRLPDPGHEGLTKRHSLLSIRGLLRFQQKYKISPSHYWGFLWEKGVSIKTCNLDVPPAVLADLYLRSGVCPAPPSKTTIWRVLTDTDPEAFDTAVGTWLMEAAEFTVPGASAAGPPDAGGRLLMQVRLDGKAVRGARGRGGEPGPAARGACRPGRRRFGGRRAG
jgi:hypothetical protein